MCLNENLGRWLHIFTGRKKCKWQMIIMIKKMVSEDESENN